MRISLVMVMVLAAAATVGCKKKKDDGKPAATGAATASGGSGGSAGSGPAGGAAGDGTQSATAEAIGELKPVSECPPALKDTDKGLSRTIPAGCTTVVEGEYYVDGVLIVEAGATLKFQPDASLHVGYGAPSKLLVRGTKDKPVTFASGGDQAAGAWRGVHLYARAARSEIKGLVLEYATVGLDVEAPDVRIEDSTFRGAKEVGVRVADEVAVAAYAGNTVDQPGELAMTVSPAALIGFGAGNVFPADAVIQLRAGAARASGTWPNPGAPLLVTGEVYIEGKAGKATIEVAAGTAFKLESGGAIYVGYGGEGELKVAGTAAAPVTFSSAGEPTPGAWERGVIAYARGVITVDHASFAHGGRDDQGALRSEGGKLAVTASVFKDNVVGLSADDATELRAFDQNQLAGNRAAGLALFPRHVGVLGAANTYDGQKIVVRPGRLDKKVTWALQAGAQVVVDGEVYVEQGGALTVPAGASYAFSDAAALYVGYGGDGSLLVQGTADKPVTFAGVRDDAASWKGVELYSRAVGSTIDHLVIKGAAGGGVRVSGGGTVKIDGLTCAKCEEAALRWDCASKVTQTGVKAEGGTPKAALAPEGC